MATELHAFVAKLRTLAPDKAAARKPSNINSQSLFAALLNNELRAQAGDAGFAQADQVVSKYFKAVLLCRKSELAAALAQLQATDALLPALPAATRSFVTLFQLSAWGNYYYKAQQSSRAIDLLRQGLHISATLERQGYPAFIYRRLEQLYNIIAMVFRDGQLGQAHELLTNTLAFTHSGQARELLIDDWDAAILGQVPVLRETSLATLFGLLASQNTRLMSHPLHHNAYYHRVFFQPLLREMETTTYNRTVLHNWLYAKASYEEQGLGAFLDNTLLFLSDPDITSAYDGLKANLLAQAIWSINQQPTGHHQLIATIRNFSEVNLADHTGLPIKLAA